MKRGILVISLILVGAVSGLAQTTFYYPQVANGVLGGVIWKTTIFLANSGTTNASGTITFRQSNGAAFPPVFVDSGVAVNSITFTDIPPGGSRKYESSGGGAYVGGFAIVVTASGTVTGTAVFSELTANGDLISEAGVPAATAVTRQAIVVDTTSGFDTGVALANPGPGPATLSLQLLNTSGVAVRTTTNCSICTLDAGRHNALFVTQIPWGQAVDPMVGTLQISSTGAQLAAVALRFSSTGIFTTLPPVTLASIFRPAIEFFQQRPWGSPFAAIAGLITSFRDRLG